MAITNLDDLQNTFYEDNTGLEINSGCIDRNEIYIRWLQNSIESESRSLTDLQNIIFGDGNRFSDWLKSLGFTGSLGDMKQQFFSGTLSFYAPLNYSLGLITGDDKIWKFDGEDDYIGFSGALSEIGVASTYSIVIWFKTGDDVTSDQVLLANTISSSDRTVCTITGGVLSFGGWNGSSWANGLRSGGLETNTLYCAILTADGTNREIYLNEVQQVGTANPGGTASSVLGFKIGDSTSSTYVGMNGDIYQVQFYDKELSESERDRVFNSGSCGVPIKTDLIARYDLQSYARIGEDNVIDLSGNGKFGTSYGKCSFSRSTTGSFIDNNGVVNTSAINVPRFKGSSKVTNLFIWSDNLSKTDWNKGSGVSVNKLENSGPNGFSAWRVDGFDSVLGDRVIQNYNSGVSIPGKKIYMFLLSKRGR